jgi:FAD/FMN-containing dehydrogenase
VLWRTLGLAVSVRGGGHNVAGRATIDDGLMIDLSPMKGIQVDAAARTARAQGGIPEGIQPRDAAAWTRDDGASLGAQVGGLTLGGGLGWLMPVRSRARHLRAADVVMADGTVVRASADTNPDLFWAIRGGGGNFGIAASLEYALHRVGPLITGGVVAHPLPRALDVLRFFRDTCSSLPDEAMLVAALQTAPDGSNAKLVGIVGSHCGPLEQGDLTFRSLKAFGPPVLDAIGPMSYSSLNGMLDPAFPKAALSYWKAQFVADLTDDAIRTLIEGFQGAHRDEPHHHRPLPRRGEPCSSNVHGLHDARHRLQRDHRVAVDGSG